MFRVRPTTPAPTRLIDRRDAVIGCEKAVLVAPAAAEAHGSLATVGKINIQPGGVNAIASSVTAWLEAGAADEPALRATVAQIEREVGNSGAVVTEESWTPHTAFDDALVAHLAERAWRCPRDGHRGGPRCRNPGKWWCTCWGCMIFVRNPTGASRHAGRSGPSRKIALPVSPALATVLADLSGGRTGELVLGGACVASAG